MVSARKIIKLFPHRSSDQVMVAVTIAVTTVQLAILNMKLT